MDGIHLNGLDIMKDYLKSWNWLNLLSKIFEKYFQIDNFIDRRGYRSFCIRLKLHHKTLKMKSCSMLWLCIVKNGQKWPCLCKWESMKQQGNAHKWRLMIFDHPTYYIRQFLNYNVRFSGLFWTPPPTYPKIGRH